ncbi:MAG: hypothetical protein KDC98_25820, partial [Planctomycetes bacterium]|nr:hypothetical protein [Planctomycetota bacterium]
VRAAGAGAVVAAPAPGRAECRSGRGGATRVGYPSPPSMSRRHVFWAIALLATAAAFAHAWTLRWTCDDAYISFRYAQHLVEGHGLVFNLDPAEAPVEGYTNFAWTMWLAVGMWLGCTGDLIETWSSLWGALAHAGTVLLLASIAWKASGGRALVPIAAGAFAAVHHAASLAPAGLETAMFTLLVTVLLRFTQAPICARKAQLAGFVGVLLAMTRPDGGLFTAIAGLFVLADAVHFRARQRLLAYVVPFLIAFVPYLLWRRFYYGYWVPNTFYAKSAGDPYPSQGLVYVWEFLKCYYALLPVVLAPLFYAVCKPDLLAPVSSWLGRRPHLCVLAFVLPYTGFVIWVGGDFMFGRFLIPILPALLLGLDLAANRWRRVVWQPVLASVMVGLLVSRVEPPWLGDYKNPHGFSDNRTISLAPFTAESGMTIIDAMRHAGHYLGGKYGELGIRVAIVGSQANLAYRGRFPVAIECATGLTDARIAHQAIAARGTVGHEKGYARLVHYLTHERRIQITFDNGFRAGDLTDQWRVVTFPVGPARLMIYDRALMTELKRVDPYIVFVDFEQVLDDYLAELATKSKAQVGRDLAAFRRYYFDHNDDPDRLARFEEFVR